MEYRLELSRRALQDAQAARDWIAQKSPGRAAKWHGELLAQIERLKHHPERYAISEEGEVLGEEVREMLFGKRRGAYRIFYTVRAETVFVLTHSAQRSWPNRIIRIIVKASHSPSASKVPPPESGECKSRP